MGIKSSRPTGKGSTSGLFVAFLMLLVWLPIPLGSNRPWSWALMEVWVYLMAAVWLFKYARGSAALSDSFRQARPALILFGLWLSYGILQMIPLPATIVAAISPNTAALHQQAQLSHVLANIPLVPNPIARPLPSFQKIPAAVDRKAAGAEVQPIDAGELNSVTLDQGLAIEKDLKSDSQPLVSMSAHSARLSLDLSASITAWFKSLSYVLLFVLTLLLVNSVQRLKTLAYVLVLSGLGQAVYGSLALAAAGSGDAHGSFINRNHYAAYLVLCLSVGIGLLIASLGRSASASDWRQRLRHMGAVILSAKAPLRIFLAIMVIALVLTHSRMGNTSFFASMLITGILALILFKDTPRSVVVLIASLIVIDIVIIGSWVGLEKVRARIEQTTLVQESRDEFDLYSFRMLQDYPLFGAGAGSYYSVFPRYREVDMGEGFLYHAHDDYLEFLTEYGILGTLLPGSVVILAMGNAILAQRRRRSQLARGSGFASLMAITAMLIHAAVEFNLQIPAYAGTFMVILATAWLSRYLASENGSQPSNITPANPR